MIRLGDGLDLGDKKKANFQVLALLTEQIVVPFMKLDSMRRDQFVEKMVTIP